MFVFFQTPSVPNIDVKEGSRRYPMSGDAQSGVTLPGSAVVVLAQWCQSGPNQTGPSPTTTEKTRSPPTSLEKI